MGPIENNKVIDFNPTMSIITLNANYLNRLTDLIKIKL